ncbi:hypothetical protein [Moorena sp. SIO3H5]|uniref:hypothetical protein n=1 Tax=Moorena sp. SIO3H5 TaxID=2607834 RepID=UPI0013B95602|nr:hypothetical protein [Moorena sp. SIO3H5]NEO69079.1 hypothetical protein [Moorena sp. SIO3H5]
MAGFIFLPTYLWKQLRRVRKGSGWVVRYGTGSGAQRHKIRGFPCLDAVAHGGNPQDRAASLPNAPYFSLFPIHCSLFPVPCSLQ